MMPTPLKQGSYTRTDGAAAGEGFPRFFLDSVKDDVASARAGRPIFTDLERVEIILPGNQFFRPVFNVTDEHRQKFSKHYEAFRDGIEMSADGTPLEEWPILQRSQILELKAMEISTVEMVAALSDHAIQRIGMGGRVLRDKAMAFLDDASRIASLEESTRQNDQLTSQIQSQNLQIEEMGKLLTQLQTQVMQQLNTPSPLATYIPASGDAIALAQANAPAVSSAPSALDRLAEPKKRGRPPMTNAAE